jgi:prevent-host-death family protein
MNTFNLYEAKTNLSRLVERAAAGEEIVIAKAGRPLARLMPLAQPIDAASKKRDVPLAC